MKRLFEINFLLVLKVLAFLTLISSQTIALEKKIFEDEDIYREALPLSNPFSDTTVPGTKWCGLDHIPLNYNELGTHREIDMCCRDHVKCYNHNNTLLAIFKCSCEQKFMNCLQAVNNQISYRVGRIYFTVRKHCFDVDHPTVGCLEYQKGSNSERCIRYQIDENRTKLYQIYDMPFYTQNKTTWTIYDYFFS